MENNLLPILFQEQIADGSVRVIGTSLASYYEGRNLDEDRECAEKKLHANVRGRGGEFVINPQIHVICGEGGAKGLAMSCFIGVRASDEISEGSSE